MSDTYWQQQVALVGGRQGGKMAAMQQAICEARERGDHVHVATTEGQFCAAAEPGDCSLPRWKDD